ncbi:peptidase [Alteromonas aestuariivivens]|uniref:Peptidase n=1 Tax=Alteromonas aestuariivivens TaxID=1938339 RepID=A0A3D8M3R7_9ALTE|nr:M14 family metallocarboxypeptidase [Alteromonas aestuariivivens]RDV24268.1 peptidase [Alteromonas aestuariivivens]
MRQYPIGTPGQPWGEQEKQLWLEQQSIKRSYQQEVVNKLPDKFAGFDILKYGALPYDKARYPLYAVVTSSPDAGRPTVLVTGGVHGYETSGVQGALQFINQHLASYANHFNFIVVPCVSPWGYETINRWNPLALDPNRSFRKGSGAPESEQVITLLDDLALKIDMHIDLHETTDTDNSEFRPALAARDGVFNDNWNIPDGFYLVANTSNPQIAFQQAIIESVRQVTHIAPADENGKIIGADLVSDGVICYDKKALFLCGGVTDAKYVTTTEVYPDSPSASPEQCNQAQIAAITGGLEYVRANA